jgi:hypothetical protein
MQMRAYGEECRTKEIEGAEETGRLVTTLSYTFRNTFDGTYLPIFRPVPQRGDCDLHKECLMGLHSSL